MARYLPQEPFDTMMISNAMMRIAPSVDEQSHFATQCSLSLRIHGADDHEAVLRAPDKLSPVIEECVSELCSELFVGNARHAAEHKLAVLRSMRAALQDLHEQHRPSFEEPMADTARRPRRQVSNARINQSAANIRTAADILRMKSRLLRLASG